jgi:hypothetical protein
MVFEIHFPMCRNFIHLALPILYEVINEIFRYQHVKKFDGIGMGFARLNIRLLERIIF